MKLSLWLILTLFTALGTLAAETNLVRTLRFAATNGPEARRWQQTARDRLFALLMGGDKPAAVPLAPTVLKREYDEGSRSFLGEITFQSLPDRRVHAWFAIPTNAASGQAKPAVLALHGHGGTGEQVVRGQGLYWYGRALIERGYVVIAPDIGSHVLQHTNWALMGERVWDALRCIDYLATRPEVDANRIGVAGLSLGGETTMYVAALDERLKAACSSGWLTTVSNMKNGHCPCWNFSGLEAAFDFADIFACVAPRPLVLEIGQKEKAPGGFPVPIAQVAFEEIRPAYRAFHAETNAQLVIHEGGHVFHGKEFWPILSSALNPRGAGTR